MHMLLNICVSIILLLGIKFNVSYQVDCEGGASFITHLSFMYVYLLPENGL
jgi:hypothetical protein